jgi:NADPH-dependent 2,4-dienoyl-CoA reductase/sulfur reductase-like enzyme
MQHLIIGTSAAGLAAAETLRRWAPGDRITLISDEPHLPYSRPLLTYLLSGEATSEQVFIRSQDYFDRWRFEALLGEPVAHVDPEAHRVKLAGGKTLRYDRLLIASGARPRLPEIPGLNLAGVHTLRHLADAERLERDLAPRAVVAVVGAGAVGLKVADALTHRGHKVLLLARGAQPLSQVLDPVAAGLLMEALGSMGIDLLLHSWPVAVLEGAGRVRGLALNNNREIAVQVVLFSVGVEPRVRFLEDTDLAQPGGIRVDPLMQTGCADIFAAGDCALPHHLITGEPRAFHIWPAAAAQGAVAGANMAGAGRRYDGVLPMNSISLRGFKVITGGHLNPDTAEGQVFSDLDRLRGRYRRLVFQNGRLAGVTLMGPVADAGIYFQIMAQKLPVKQLPADIRSRDFHAGKLWG